METLQAWLNAPAALALFWSLALLLAAWLADLLTQHLLLRVVRALVRASPTRFDDALLARGVLDRLAHVVPALVVHQGIVWVPGIATEVETVLRNVASAWMVMTVTRALSALLNGLNDIWMSDAERARTRPIKGFIQVMKLLLAVGAGLWIVAILIERSPVLLLSGLGAMTAVLLLVFKDTILSLVASVQLGSNDMVRIGDWIEMPQLGADGEVIDIALHTVKVQNWDKTLTTIPTWRLIGESFRNWRGMSESGGRRIKRALLIDQGSIRFLADDEREHLRRLALIDPYLQHKQAEIEAWNEQLLAAGKDPVNVRRVTNIGTFRAYVEAYLRAHPRVRQDMTLLVRQLDPGANGLPLEIYCFTATTNWNEYEAIQADIFDHLFAIAGRFGLRLFQNPSSGDLRSVAQLLAGQGQAAERSAPPA